MPLNITDTADPTPLSINPATPAAAEEVKPPSIEGLTAVKLPPMVDVGFRLAKYVLCIAAGSIGALMIYLAAMGFVVGTDIREIFGARANQAQTGAGVEIQKNIEKLAADLSTGRGDENWQMPADAQSNATQLINALDRIPDATPLQKTQLKECVPLPDKNNSRTQKIDQCLSVLAALKPAMIYGAIGIAAAQNAAEFAGKLNEHRQSFHQFWIQAAQLILLNLLLPLLTALFGYIFGTQHAQASNNR